MDHVVKHNRVEQVLEAVASGKPITHIFKDIDGISQGTFYKRLADDEELREAYKKAQLSGSYAMHDKARDVAMNALDGKLPGDCKNHNIPKLGFDIVKWSTAKTNPTVFGDKPEIAIQINMIDDLLGDNRAGGANPLADIIGDK